MAREGKIYFFGSSDGKFIKIGHTSLDLQDRKKQLLSGQFMKIDLHLLAAVRGTATHEDEIQEYFSHLTDDANSTETFRPGQELLHYINWLRQQWWTCLDYDEKMDEIPAWPTWMPTPDRIVQFAEEDPWDLIPKHLTYHGPLAGTPWNRLSTPSPKIGEDFYTPADIVNAARDAMGGIDLDAASHWQANRIHKIPLYFHLHRSAFDNEWIGRVWLNPPYGNNKPWFECIVEHWDAKRITQLCMISPVWVFTTQMALPVIKRSSAMTLLTPTPSFWGNPRGRTGTNHPHAIIYLGSRVQEFKDAFAKYGVPFKLLLDENTSALKEMIRA